MPVFAKCDWLIAIVLCLYDSAVVYKSAYFGIYVYIICTYAKIDIIGNFAVICGNFAVCPLSASGENRAKLDSI